MSKYEEVNALIDTLDSSSKDYLKDYFKCAPSWVYDSIQVVNYDSNRVIIKQGTPLQNIMILVKGIVKGTDYPILGAMYDFMWFDAVRSFGALEYFVNETVFNASLIAATPCTILQLPLTVYNQWMRTDINALRIDTSTTSRQLLFEIRRERVYIFMQGTDRLTYFLMLYYKQFAVNGTCRITLTRQEISDSTGLSIRTVNRGLTALLNQDCLSKSGNSLIICEQKYDNLAATLESML